MNNMYKKILLWFLSVVLIFALVSCARPSDDDNPDTNQIETPESPDIDLENPGTIQPDVSDDELIGDGDIVDNQEGNVILLKKDSVEFTGKNITVIDSSLYGIIVNISASGSYVVQGTLTNGFIAISEKELEVTLILNGVNIYCSNYSPIVCTKKSNVKIILNDNSTNYLTDGTTYAYDYDTGHEPNACLYIRKDLEITGNGSLIVNANNNNGIGTKAHLNISDATITVNAINNALKGNDSINIRSGIFKLISHEDGIKSDNIEEDGLGYIRITGGIYEIVCVNDAIQSSTYLEIKEAEMKIKTGNGSSASVSSDSAKGLKAATYLTIESGIFNIDSNDDGIHSDGNVTISGGVINISSGDDGIHANETLTISGGTINISKSYEGLESKNMYLNGGSVKLIASDDGINISGGVDSSATNPRPGGRPGTPGGQSVIDGTLTINDGYYYLNSSGDGLDSNGNIIMNGGVVIVHGPTSSSDAPIDYDGTFVITGGILIALGSSGMAQQPGSSSTQYSVLVKFTTNVTTGSLLNIKDSSGESIITIACMKAVKSIVISTSTLTKGSYTLSYGGTYSVAPNEYGLYSGGTVIKTFNISSIITTVN